MEELHSRPESCIYIGDSEVDIETAKNAGIPCISVNWGFKDTGFLEAHGASCIVSTPDELLKTILFDHLKELHSVINIQFSVYI